MEDGDSHSFLSEIFSLAKEKAEEKRVESI